MYQIKSHLSPALFAGHSLNPISRRTHLFAEWSVGICSIHPMVLICTHNAYTPGCLYPKLSETLSISISGWNTFGVGIQSPPSKTTAHSRAHGSNPSYSGSHAAHWWETAEEEPSACIPVTPWEPGIEVWAPGFGWAQAWLTCALGKWNSRWESSVCLLKIRKEEKNREIKKDR